MVGMSFAAYIENIRKKTGMTPDEFKARAAERGFIRDGQVAPGIKAMQVVGWLKDDYGLGHGHAMAIYATFTGRGA
jgi:Domain of unknown function (DUF4287)